MRNVKCGNNVVRVLQLFVRLYYLVVYDSKCVIFSAYVVNSQISHLLYACSILFVSWNYCLEFTKGLPCYHISL